MKFSEPIKLPDIAKIISAPYFGNSSHIVTGLNEIHRVEKGDLVFVDNEKYYQNALLSNASTLLIDKRIQYPEDKAIIVSDDPLRDFNNLTTHFRPPQQFEGQISPSSSIGHNTEIGPGVFIGRNVQIGDNCIVYPNTTIYDNCIIGDDSIIHSGAVIGSDGFYFQRRTSGYKKLETRGRVIIENSVEIGASCTVDKGVTADTIIGHGTKLDNQVHIGHDTRIGNNCLLAAQVAVAGMVVVEDDVVIWGQGGIISNVVIGKGAVILAQSGITKSLPGDKVYFGTPARDNLSKLKELALIRKIPQIIEQLDKITP
jgi:UDP-3-O-[3-hydroxymyristoyl] glucosamine N-acyltransferase